MQNENGSINPHNELTYAACNYAHNLALYATGPTAPPNYYEAAYTIATVPDGASNTISFAERLGNCGTAFSSTRDLPTKSHAQQDTSTIGLPVLTSGKSESLPLPQFGVTQATCTGKTASTAHTGVMVVGLLDGSVHLMRSGISQTTFYQLINPADGQAIGPDW